jgi:hypothetical protein
MVLILCLFYAIILKLPKQSLNWHEEKGSFICGVSTVVLSVASQNFAVISSPSVL